MISQIVKYSIVIPVHNSLKYLPTCVDTIISQAFDNYELIISDDSSDDGTESYLSNLKHPNIKVVRPEKRLTMVEHFEWSLKHARGEWVMFVGGDDGLQSYFFELVEKLTEIAETKNIRAIMSERAYYFWPGCEALYGEIAVSYSAIASTKILNSTYQSILALLGFQTYFELPEMYTNSLFKRSLIEEAKKKQSGALFSTVPPDANLGAIACSLEKRYLKSLIPLGWIGTSPGGVLISMESVSKEKVAPTSEIGYHSLAGDFALRSCSVYYWNALLRTPMLRSDYIHKLLMSKTFRTLMFAGVLAEIRTTSKIDAKTRTAFFNEALAINQCSPAVVKLLARVFPLLYKLSQVKDIVYLKVLKAFRPGFNTTIYWNKEPSAGLLHTSEHIAQKIKAEMLPFL